MRTARSSWVCPFWAISGHPALAGICPLCSRKRTFGVAPSMSPSISSHVYGSVWLTAHSFESLLFTIAIAFLLLAMAKERNELRHRIAATLDPLTGIANRRSFMRNTAQLAKRLRAEAPALSTRERGTKETAAPHGAPSPRHFVGRDSPGPGRGERKPSPAARGAPGPAARFGLAQFAPEKAGHSTPRTKPCREKEDLCLKFTTLVIPGRGCKPRALHTPQRRDYGLWVPSFHSRPGMTAGDQTCWPRAAKRLSFAP